MNIWEAVENSTNIEDIWVEVEKQSEENKYLANPEAALTLISTLLQYKEDLSELKSIYRRLDLLVEEEFRRLADFIHIQDEIAIYQKLLQIKEKIKELNYLRLFSQMNFIAIGGGVNAGKSTFINSIIGMDILPEDQVPSTSIPTYITRGEKRLSAYTFRNQQVEIDEEAMQAFSHVFYNRYKISFSKIIKNIHVQTPTFPYDNFVLLDTPGYTKAESFKLESNTDKYMAREQLRVADYVIWLMDIDNGVINDKDLQFLEKSGVSVPILFVFNKADLKPESQIKEIVKNTEEVIKQRGFKVFGVTAYSSRQKKEYTGGLIQEFLEFANQKVGNEVNFITELEEVIKVYELHIKKTAEIRRKQKKEIIQLFLNATYLHQLPSLAEVYSSINADLSTQNKLERKLQHLEQRFLEILSEIDAYTEFE